MTTSDLLQQIRKNLEKRRLEIAEGMVDGRMTDINAYHKNVGIAEGLMQASEVIRETLKKLNEEDV
jgi:CRISPR/Cas system-associated endonuclease Cas1